LDHQKQDWALIELEFKVGYRPQGTNPPKKRTLKL